MKFCLRLVNIPDAGFKFFPTEEEALSYGKKSGFQFQVVELTGSSLDMMLLDLKQWNTIQLH